MDSLAEHTETVVEIDRELMSVVPDYLESRRLDCHTIECLLRAGDLVGIRTLGHRLKGSGGSYGFDEISEIGEILENAALVGDAVNIESSVELLKIYLSRIKVVYV